ncbi:hypothetical protein D3C83_327840 [compost metagenome]
MLLRDGVHFREVLVQHLGQVFRLQLLGNVCEPDEVREKDRQLAPFVMIDGLRLP